MYGLYRLVMKIATFNVNSVRARLPNLLNWLKDLNPDIVLLQETKVVDDLFPTEAIEELGYNLAVHGQKTYNGGAILSKTPLEDVKKSLPGDQTDNECRYIEAFTNGVRVASIYVPQGTNIESARFQFKLKFLERVYAHTKILLDFCEPFVLGGDWNVAPDPDDVYDPQHFHGELCFHPEERAHFRKLLWLGLTDAFRAINPQAAEFSYWDYRGRYWRANQGLRIDHLLLSPLATDRLITCTIDRAQRGLENPSDHAPVWCEISSAPTYLPDQARK